MNVILTKVHQPDNVFMVCIEFRYDKTSNDIISTTYHTFLHVHTLSCPFLYFLILSHTFSYFCTFSICHKMSTAIKSQMSLSWNHSNTSPVLIRCNNWFKFSIFSYFLKIYKKYFLVHICKENFFPEFLTVEMLSL